MKRYVWFMALCLAVAASGTPAGALEHFKCYPTGQNEPVDAGVLLRDQFGTDKAHVLESLRFCNPAEKTHRDKVTPIRNKDAHLELYRIETRTDSRPREVEVSNQFGRGRKLEVGRPLFLAVPTWKQAPGEHRPPRDLDHFKCYEARGEPVEGAVALGDQFGFERGLKVTRPMALCNPAGKTHDEKVTRVLHPEDHLVCYELRGTERGARAKTRNQFREETHALEPADMLCVPSRKRELGVERVPGEVKDTDRPDVAAREGLAEAAPPTAQCQSPTPDFVVTGSESTAPGDEHCFPSNGAGAFGPRSNIPRLNVVDGMDVADMDGDGDNDFLACDGLAGEVYLYTQGPAGTFVPTVVASGVTSGVAGSLFCTYLRVADFNGDGQADFVVGDNRVTQGTFVYLQGPPGNFAPVAPGLDVGWASPAGAPCNCLFGLAAGDVDGDGHQDVVVLGYRGAGAGQVHFYAGNGTGGMAPPVLKFDLGADFPVVDAPTGIALFDQGGDGDLDLVVGGAADGSHYVYSNDGAGNFAAPAGPVFSVDNYTGIDAYDVDGDLDDDLVLVDWSNRRLLFGENLGGGGLAAPLPVGNVDGASIGIGAPRLIVRTPPRLGHFKCYPAEAEGSVGETVVLSDQFGTGKADVVRADHFCNPVAKIHEDRLTPIPDRDAHLELYRIETETAAPQRVQVANQFGRGQSLEVERPLFLAVPTQKVEPGGHPPPRGLDHLKCYQVHGEPVDAHVELRDQFGFEPGLSVHEPVLLCNPAQKIHREKITPVENPEDHLVCYKLAGTQREATAQVRNQFGEDVLGLQPADLLCVPSTKTDPFREPNITLLCGVRDAIVLVGGMVAPGGPGTGLLRENPSALWPDGRPRRPCGEYVPIEGYLPGGGVNRFRVAYRKAGDPVPPLGTAPGIPTRWILRDRSMSIFCQVNPAHVLETSADPLAWMDASLYLEAFAGGPSTDFCPNNGLRLAVWDSADHMSLGLHDPNGHYVLWLEWEDGGGVLHKEPFEHHLQLDNKLPDLNDLRVTLSDGTTPVGACGEAPQGEDTFRISADFADDYYWSYRVLISGGSPPITVSYPLAAEDPDGNHWHDYYEGTPAVAATDRTGTVPDGSTVFLRELDMNDFGASFTDCCYLLRLRVRDAAIRHSFNHRVANDATGAYWDDVSQFITFSASP